MTELLRSPVFALALTVGVYRLAVWLHARAGGSPLLTPVLVSIVVVAGVLAAVGVDTRTYLDGAAPISLLLAPATVALAVPLHRERERIRAAAGPLALGLVAGVVTAVAAAAVATYALGGSSELGLSMIPKSATTPVAIGVAERIGGIGPLSAALAIVTGILGAVLGPALLSLARVRDPRARGFALGVASHGIGTSRALQESAVAGAFAGLGLGLGAVATAVLVPIVVQAVPALR